MNSTVQIPGICDPEAAIEPINKKEEITHKLVLDYYDGSLTIYKLLPGQKIDPKYHTEIQELDEAVVSGLGKVIEDRDYDDDLDIHCDRCNKFYRPYCKKHPLFRIPDRQPSESKEPLAVRTLPCLFRIEESKIPNAGKGVFAEAFIPIGMTFGPYRGAKCTKKSDFFKDGYAWEIKKKDGNGKDANFFIDGSHPERSNWLRYINSPRHEAEQNMLAFQVNGKVFYRVIKPIKINEELLVWYGTRFGSDLINGPQDRNSKKKNPFIL